MPAQVRTLQLAYVFFFCGFLPFWPGWMFTTLSNLPSYVSIDMESTFLLMENSFTAELDRSRLVLMGEVAVQFESGLAGQPCSMI